MSNRKKPSNDEAETVVAVAKEELRNVKGDAPEYMRDVFGEIRTFVSDRFKLEIPTNIRFTAGFTEHGKSLTSKILVQVIYPKFTVDGNYEVIARFAEGFQENLIEELYCIVPRILRGTPDLDLKTRDLASAVQLEIIKGVKNARPKKMVRDELLSRLEREYGDIPHRGIKFDLLNKKRKEGMTGGKDPQTGRMLKVVCRECIAKPGTKGNILRRSQGAILSYGITTCRDHGDMIVEIRKKDKPLLEGVPFYVIDVDTEEAAPDMAPPADQQDNSAPEQLDAAE